MLSQLLQLLNANFSSMLGHGTEVTILLITAWLTWYVWRFTICPAMYPREPKQMPYWLPGRIHQALTASKSDLDLMLLRNW